MDSAQVTEYERALIAAAMLQPDGVTALIKLESKDFYNEYCRLTAHTIKDLWSRNVPIDLVTVSNAVPLADDGMLDRPWWRGYLTDLLLQYQFNLSGLPYYVDAIREASQRRKLERVTIDLAKQIKNSDLPSSALIAAHLQEIAALTATFESTGLVHIADLTTAAVDLIRERIENPAEITGAPTGLREFDLLTTGFQPGELILIGARPSMGKTSLALCWAAHMAISCGLPINIFSLEMSRFALIQKLIAIYTGIDTIKLRTGTGLNDFQFEAIERAVHTINKAPLYIADETSGIKTVGAIKAKKAEQRLIGVKSKGDVFDHIGLMHSEEQLDNPVQEMRIISRSLKEHAAEDECFVMALSQLGRAVEQRPNKRPMLSDLRESGSLEQDASMVVFIYRDEYYNPESDKRGEAEVILAKQREGPTGTVHALYDSRTQIFCSKLRIDGEQPEAPPAPPPPKKEEPDEQTDFTPPEEYEVFPLDENGIAALAKSRTHDELFALLETEIEKAGDGPYAARAQRNMELGLAWMNANPPAPPAEPAWYDM